MDHEGDETPRTWDAWIECGGGPAALLESLNEWAVEQYGGQPFPFDTPFVDLLEMLAMRGYRVTAIEAPDFAAILPAPTE